MGPTPIYIDALNYPISKKIKNKAKQLSIVLRWL